jgi:hypothetical protein
MRVYKLPFTVTVPVAWGVPIVWRRDYSTMTTERSLIEGLWDSGQWTAIHELLYFHH